MKLEDVVHHFIKDAMIRQRSEHTLSAYRRCLAVLVRLLRDVCGMTELERVTVLHLRECVQYLSTTSVLTGDRADRPASRRGHIPANGGILSVSSVRTYVRIWKVFFRWCYLEDLIEKDIIVRLVLPKPEKRVIVAFTTEHLEKILRSFDLSTEMGFRDYVIVMLLLDTGMRLSEISGLTVDAVHDDYVKVFGKGRQEREIGIYPEVSKLLWKYVHKYRHPLDPKEKALFLGRGKPLGVNGFKLVVKRLKQATGISDVRVSPHTFRHTFAKMYLDQGGELFKLSRELGHSDIQVTKVYLEDFGSTEARRDHTSYSPLAGLQLNKQKRYKRRD